MPLKSWNTLLDEAGDQATAFTVLPAADYDVEIEKAEAKMSGKNNLYFAVTAKIVNGPHMNRKLWSNITVVHDNPVALGIFFRTMAALGIAKEYFAADPSDAQVADQLVGRKARVQVGIKQYQGSDRNEIKNWHPMKETSGSPVPPPPAVVPAAQNPAPTPAAPQVAPAPAPAAPAAATAPPAPAPVQTETAPPPPVQPEVPPVPETQPVAAAPAATPPLPPQAEPAPAAPAPPAPQGDALPPPPEVGKPF